MKIRLAFLVAFVVGAAGMRLAAHHSFAAQYDPTKAIRITGTLSKVEWGNPHTYFYLDVKEPDGTVVTWGCEGAAPAQLSRRGFKRGDLKLGDTMTVDGYRARDGSHLIDARRVTLADGRIVSGGSLAMEVRNDVTAVSCRCRDGGLCHPGDRSCLCANPRAVR